MNKTARRTILIASTVFLVVATYFSTGISASVIVFDAIFGKRCSTLNDLRSNYYQLVKNRSDYQSLSKREVLSFMSGENRLTGYYYPGGKGTVICLHGMASQSDGDDAEYQNYFVEKGYSLFAVDLTASGRSKGEDAKGLHQSAYDALAAYRFLVSEGRLQSPLIMVGHSWGGFGAAACLSIGVKADYVITFSAFENPIDAMLNSAVRYTGWFGYLTYPPFAIGTSIRYGDDARLSAKSSLKNSSAEALLFHGDKDETVKPGDSLSIKAESLSNVRSVILSGAGHERPWVSNEARSYVDDFLFSLGKDVDSFTEEEINSKIVESGFDKNRGSELSEEVVSAIENLLKTD